ncbi:MAG: phosphate/phosphite/phosphonate ABC transporter substrate-binding protein [Candidatus Omnitrophica bacterium]|nr:phosphate/phosphite/phosphonate ABC transporter substrate-binding protein [Candidatus Omnitrophota bacterium]
MFLTGGADGAEKSDRPIYLGVLPEEKPTEMLKRFEELERYLREETGLNIHLKFYPTAGITGGLTAIVMEIANGDIDFAWLNAVTCVQANGVGPVVPFACGERKGGPYYRGYLAVRANSPYQSFMDLRGKMVCGTSASSVSGNLIPTAWLLDKKLDKFTLFKFYYLGREDNAARAVLVGEFEGCFINEYTFDNFNENGVKLRSIWEHPAVPENPFCVNTEKVSPEVLEKVKTALFNMDKKDLAGIKAVNKKYEKWTPAQWEDYTSIKRLTDMIYGQKFYDLYYWRELADKTKKRLQQYGGF